MLLIQRSKYTRPRLRAHRADRGPNQPPTVHGRPLGSRAESLQRAMPCSEPCHAGSALSTPSSLSEAPPSVPGSPRSHDPEHGAPCLLAPRAALPASKRELVWAVHPTATREFVSPRQPLRMWTTSFAIDQIRALAERKSSATTIYHIFVACQALCSACTSAGSQCQLMWAIHAFCHSTEACCDIVGGRNKGLGELIKAHVSLRYNSSNI